MSDTPIFNEIKQLIRPNLDWPEVSPAAQAALRDFLEEALLDPERRRAYFQSLRELGGGKFRQFPVDDNRSDRLVQTAIEQGLAALGKADLGRLAIDPIALTLVADAIDEDCPEAWWEAVGRVAERLHASKVPEPIIHVPIPDPDPNQFSKRRLFLVGGGSLIAGLLAGVLGNRTAVAKEQKTLRQDLDDTKRDLDDTKRERDDALRALAFLEQEGYLNPIRFADGDGSGGVGIKTNNSLLFSGVVALDRIQTLWIYTGEAVEPIEISTENLKPLAGSERFARFSREHSYKLLGQALETKLEVVLTAETREMRVKAGQSAGPLVYSAKFLATPFGLVVDPGTVPVVAGLPSPLKVTSLTPTFNNLRAIRSGSLAVYLATSGGELHLVSRPQPVSPETPFPLRLRMPANLPAGNHELICGIAQSTEQWPVESREAEVPFPVDRLPAPGGLVSYTRLPVQSPDPERRLAEWVLLEQGNVEIQRRNNITQVIPVTDSAMLPSDRFYVSMVSLDGTSLSAADLAHNLTGEMLRFLNLCSTAIDDASLGIILERHAGLKMLLLGNTSIGDEGVKAITEKVPALHLLQINETRITDRSVETLSGMAQLTELHLNDNLGISDNSLQALERGFPRLNTIRVGGTRMTEPALKQLEVSRPELKVIR